MEWKVGDRIKFIKEGGIDSFVRQKLTLNKIYEIIKMNYEDRNIDPSYYCQILRDNGERWWITKDCFKLIKDKQSEVEVLDCFQDNFKEGI